MLIPWSERSERNGISTATRELRWGQVAKRTVRAMVVEVLSPSPRLEPRVAVAQQIGLLQIPVRDEYIADASLQSIAENRNKAVTGISRVVIVNPID